VNNLFTVLNIAESGRKSLKSAVDCATMIMSTADLPLSAKGGYLS